jgi:hypothetical protein
MLPWGRLLIVVAALAVAIAAAARSVPAERVEAVDPPLYFALGCEFNGLELKDECTYHEGATSGYIDVFAVNNTGTQLTPSSWTFTIRSNQASFDPNAADFYDPAFGFTFTGWTCGGPPVADRDTNADPALADSVVSCIDALNHANTPKLQGNGQPLQLLRIKYDVLPGTGARPFTIVQGEMTTREAVSMSCTDPGSLVPCFGATNNAIPVPGIDGPGPHFIVDCDAGAPGIQSVCGVPMGTVQAKVAVYTFQNGGAPTEVGAFNFYLTADQTKIVPIVPDLPYDERNHNPDVNDYLLTPGFWACSPIYPTPDYDPDPLVAASLLSCFESSGTGFPFRDGQLRLVGTVTYNVAATSPGFTDLSLPGSGSGDPLGYPIVDCFPAVNGPAHGTCHGARLYITGSLFDADGDGRNNVVDNCIEAPNGLQENADRINDLPPTKMFDDATRANSDKYGDVCDLDNDNDGLHDTRETSGPPCASASAATNPLAVDSDGDRVTDGAECALGSDPTNALSLPAAAMDSDNDGLPNSVEPLLDSNPASNDTDGDGLLDGLEVRGWATSPSSADSDGDGCADKYEIASVNADQMVNSIDLSQVAQSFSNTTAAPYLVEFDMNKDGKINSIDLSFVAQRFGSC